MAQFVVLLRGVNVGNAKRLPMARFRALLAGLGYTEVRTLLNSGNAVYGSTARSTAAMAAYLHCVDGILESKAGAALLGKAGQAITTRNWATVLKLRALLEHEI